MPYPVYQQMSDPESTANILTFPEDLTEIPETAVAFNEKITHVLLHDNIKKIGNRAFHYCKNLQHVFLPDGLEYIISRTFSVF